MPRNVEATKPQLTSRVLLILGLLWIFGAGALSAWVGVTQILAGNVPYGAGLFLIGVCVVGSALFLRREFAPLLSPE